ncbi:hypothetical protein OH77DRAFT_426323 [Trametes cingulata]|nr:hypothetical protein OH77DRAFT_426323 [Trametes cingulata]
MDEAAYNGPRQVPTLLQEDLLYCVFDHIAHPHALALAASVCRAWTIPAQAALYREIEYSPLTSHRRERLLARTMRTRPHLLRLVRRLYLITIWTHSPTPELCDWITRIPPDRLIEFRWTWERGHPLPSLLDSPAVRATRSIELRGRLYTLESVRSILELPFLESLSLELKGDEQGHLTNVTPSKLRHLHLVAQGGYSRAVETLLSTVGPQLQSFRLACNLGENSERDGRLASCVATHCPNLGRFEIEAIASPQAPVPFADALVRRCGSLECLRCGGGTYTSAIFRGIPPSLRVLALAIAPTLEAPLLEYLKTDTPGRGRLARLELVGDEDEERDRRIEDACSSRGVVLRFSSR